ncbi:lytic transglycosylase domain-containing protein [Mycobacterium sp. B14F4]|uniref:lytic transglycosylase domain-containing protein n=1 Tax=Mycobacterium sp. B14F4 TaxID=3153565 RepID=UPI00325D206F
MAGMSAHGTGHRRATALLAFALACVLAACSESTTPPTPTTATAEPPAPTVSTTATPPTSAQPRLAADPIRIAEDLVVDEHTIRAPSTSEAVLTAAARRQQRAYRVLARHPEWDAIVGPRIPPALLGAFDRNINARRQLARVNGGAPPDTMPAWRIVAPPPAAELLAHYRKAQDATGVGWNFLAAINLIETGFGRIVGASTAGAQGPMQFMPSTFAAYGQGGDIHSPHDSIMAAGKYLAANGFGDDPGRALYRYNNSERYVDAVTDYAAVLAAEPATFAAYHRWDVYYVTTAGDIVLPVGYTAETRIPVQDYLATHPQ